MVKPGIETAQGTSADASARQRILEAARSAFIRQGYHGARMQDIANNAGINKALLHYYFQNKENLFDLVFQDAFSEFLPRLQAILSSKDPVIDKIEAYLGAHLHLLQSRPDLPLFILNEVYRDPERFFTKFMHHLQGASPFSILLEQIAEEMEAGILRPMNPRELWFNVMSMVVFPVIARPILQKISATPDREYVAILEQRQQSLLLFIRNAIVLTERPAANP